MEPVKVRQALISVSDKRGLLELADRLLTMGVALLATGGTHRLLNENGIAVTEVADYTGFPEMMGGRVKTLHPRIHGGLLGRRNVPKGEDDLAVMEEHGIAAIDLVVVNLYPFEQVTAEPGCDLARAIENIDIGGPAMLRSAAKNYNAVAVVVDVADYAPLLQEMAELGGGISRHTRFRLAVKAFDRVARYDAAISEYLGRVKEERP